MPRPIPDTSKAQPYAPSPPPLPNSTPPELIRAIWDEFYRLQALLSDIQAKLDELP